MRYAPTIEAIAGRIELPVLRKLLASLDGRHGGLRAGHGQDLEDMAEYRPGDDVKDIDWKASAKHARPIIKRFETTANLSVILAVDTGRTMAAAAGGGESKEQVALATAEIIAWLTTQRGDRIGLVAGDAERLRHLPARTGNSHAETLLRHIEGAIDVDAPRPDLAKVLRRVEASTRRRSLIVIISDDTQPDVECEPIVKRLRVHHEIIVLAVSDADPTSFEAGTQVIDVVNGPLPDFIVADEQLSAQARQAVEERKSAVAQMLRRQAITVAHVGATQEVARALADALERRS